MTSLLVHADAGPRPARVWRGATLTWAAVVSLWLLLVLSGMFALARYSNAPAAKDPAPDQWPSASGISADPQRPTLVMLAHPHCPCTRASLAELSRLVTRLPGQLSVYVLFIRPRGAEADWESTDLVERAGQIPGVHVKVDDEGREAALFGARTSGEAILYGKDGRRLFHGGITSARGHEGDNVGSTRIVSLVSGGSTEEAQSAVFGCALMNDPSSSLR
jgi:hypothetical protein